jgi:hypothetical protein
MLLYDTPIEAASLLIPPVLLTIAAVLVYRAYRKGTIRRSLAYLVLSRSRRRRLVIAGVLGFAFFVPAGVFAFLGLIGVISIPTASTWSAVTRLIASLSLFLAAVLAVRDVPVNAAELPEVAEFRADVVSLGLAEGVDASVMPPP